MCKIVIHVPRDTIQDTGGLWTLQSRASNWYSSEKAKERDHALRYTGMDGHFIELLSVYGNFNVTIC